MAAVLGPGGVQLWVDGNLIDEEPSFATSWTTNMEYLQVGGLGWSSPSGGSKFINPFSGEIADVEIYGEALLGDQIDELASMSSFDLI